MRFPPGSRCSLKSVPKFESGDITALVRSPGKDHIYGLGTVTGRVIPVYVDFRVTFEDDVRTIEPVVTSGEPLVKPSRPVSPLHDLPTGRRTVER